MEEVKVTRVEKQGLQAMDVVVVAVLLAAGAVLRMITPPFFGITPNVVIGMYVLAIMLLKPRLPQVLGIGLVAAAVCQLTTKSLLPYLNFASEPVGAIVTALLLYLPFDKNGFSRAAKPFVVTFLGTFASGFTYITIFKAVTLFATLPKNPAYTYLLMVVLVTGVFNAILAQVLYFPLKQLLKNM
ncbi:tryptophan transporter [Neomoorella carbonis]|uniref:tryptophan transporter n=1 Tax=Neomoorella carbonis TaxID=3062783 RepID=UPI0032562EFD